MNKTVLAAAGFDNQKYYLAEEFTRLPEGVKEEIRTICVLLADKLMCTFIIGFYDDGEVYFETVKSKEILDFDDIGAHLEIKRIEQEHRQLLEGLRLYYKIYVAGDGQEAGLDLLKESEKG